MSKVLGRNITPKNHDLRLDAQTGWSVARDIWVDKGAVWAHVLLCVRIVQHEDGDIFGCHALVVEPAVVLVVANFGNLVGEMWVDYVHRDKILGANGAGVTKSKWGVLNM